MEKGEIAHFEQFHLFPKGFLKAQPSTDETQKSMNNVSCRRDMTEILLKAA